MISSTKVLIEQDGWRILLDFGIEYSPVPHLFRGRVAPRPGHILTDRLKTGGVPWIPHLYRPDALRGIDLPGGTDGQTALFITHAHPDHMGLLGWVDPQIPIYSSSKTQSVMKALHNAGIGPEGERPHLTTMKSKRPLHFGPFRVTSIPVDHDVPGAVGYLVETEDGCLAYTGDIRLHGRHPEFSLAFAQAAQGAQALIIEGTTLSWDKDTIEPTEAEIDQQFHEVITKTRGLVMLSVNPVNLERVSAYLKIARSLERRILWPLSHALFLKQMGLADIHALDPLSAAAVHRDPNQYIVQIIVPDLALLLDLPTGPNSLFIYSNGEPYGPDDPEWNVLMDWLRYTQTPFQSVATSGHASPPDLHRLIELTAPKMVFPVHTLHPERITPSTGTQLCLPERGGQRFSLNSPGRA